VWRLNDCSRQSKQLCIRSIEAGRYLGVLRLELSITQGRRSLSNSARLGPQTF
jgi:hypothetical protein